MGAFRGGGSSGPKDGAMAVLMEEHDGVRFAVCWMGLPDDSPRWVAGWVRRMVRQGGDL